MLKQNHEYKIVNYIENETKGGDLLAKVQLVDTDTDEKINCVIWEFSLCKIEKRALKIGNIIYVTESDFNEKFNNYIIKQIKLIKEVSIGLSAAQREEKFNKITDIVGTLNDEKLKISILEQLREHKELFKIAPAAKRHHHNYVGGLMQHIIECVDYAKALFSVTKTKVNNEVVLAGCIMHDFGKIFEYIVDLESGDIEVNHDWQDLWINHIAWGFSWANSNGFFELGHVIASHHGIKDFGSLVEPGTREAELLHEIDMLSSRLGKISVEDLEFDI